MLTLLLSLAVTSLVLFLLLFAEFAYADDDESVCLDEIMKIGVELSNKNVKYVSQIELRALS